MEKNKHGIALFSVTFNKNIMYVLVGVNSHVICSEFDANARTDLCILGGRDIQT